MGFELVHEHVTTELVDHNVWAGLQLFLECVNWSHIDRASVTRVRY
jgi:hypothetical protein